MKKRTRDLLIITISIVAIIALALADITSYGRITTGFLGMALLLLGSSVIPTILEIRKENKKGGVGR